MRSRSDIALVSGNRALRRVRAESGRVLMRESTPPSLPKGEDVQPAMKSRTASARMAAANGFVRLIWMFMDFIMIFVCKNSNSLRDTISFCIL